MGGSGGGQFASSGSGSATATPIAPHAGDSNGASSLEGVDVDTFLSRLGRPTTLDQLRHRSAPRLVTIELAALRSSITRVLTKTLIERLGGEFARGDLSALVTAAERELSGEIAAARVGSGAKLVRHSASQSVRDANLALVGELARHGRATTPDELRRRGLHRVAAIKVSEVSVLIERAVNRVLWAREPATPARPYTPLEYTPELAASREQVAEYRRAMQEELGALRGTIAARRGFAEQQENADNWPFDTERRDELKLRVHARLMPIFDLMPRGTVAERQVVADLLSLFAEERAIELANARRAADAEVAQLERRISKLVGHLEATEALLESVTIANSAEPGIASQYRDVQGLTGTGAELRRRRAIMEMIFQANVELQTGIVKEH